MDGLNGCSDIPDITTGLHDFINGDEDFEQAFANGECSDLLSGLGGVGARIVLFGEADGVDETGEELEGVDVGKEVGLFVGEEHEDDIICVVEDVSDGFAVDVVVVVGVEVMELREGV